MKKVTVKMLSVALVLVVAVSFIPLAGLPSLSEEIYASNGAYTGILPTLATPGQAISTTAINLAWPVGTQESKYKYRGGSATKAFKTALDAAFPKHGSWGAKASVGSSCDVFAGTVIKSCGYDPGIPRGVTEGLTYFPSHPEKWKPTGITAVTDMKPGDVILWAKSSGTKHICIYVEINGKPYRAEAHYNSGGGMYGHISPINNYKKSNYSFFEVYRPCDTSWTTGISEGMSGNNVKHLQSFLNWAGYDCGKADGSFGTKTYKALKAWQEASNLTADGRFGKASLAAATRQVAKLAKPAVPADPPTASDGTTYGGTFPEVSSKGLKKKSKGTQVKHLQKFLNWYGISAKVDGKFGNATHKAVKKFQKAEGLKVDGVFGKASLKKAKKIRK